MTGRVLRLLYHFAVYAVGIIVLTAAVLVSLVRLFLPDVGIYRSEVQAWVSSYMGLPVVIRSLEADWHGWIPHLYLRDIDLLDRARTAPVITFSTAEIAIDPLRTLRERRIVPRQLTVSGFDVSVTRLPNGGLFVEGMGGGGGADLTQWLLMQRTIRIENASVEWIDRMGAHDEPVRLTSVSAMLRSDGDRLQIEASADLPGGYGKRFDLAFDAVGNLLTADWSGEIYMHATQVNPRNWFRHYRPVDFRISDGTADIRVWSLWSQARLVQVEGELRYHDFTAVLGKSTLAVERLDYRFLAERTPDGGWHLHMKLNDFATEHGLWPRSNIRVDVVPVAGRSDFRYRMRFDYLKLDDLAPLATHLTFIPEGARERLASLRVSGMLRDGMITFDPGAPDGRQRLVFESAFEDLATDFGGSGPELRRASGRVRGTPEAGTLEFSGQPVAARLPALKISNLAFESVRGEVTWRRDGERWTLETPHLDLRTADFDAAVAGSIALPRDGAPVADLRMQVGNGPIDRIAAFLPHMDRFKLKPWIRNTVGAGRLASAAALLRGDLSRFPFDDRSGRFLAIVNLEDVLFDYSPNWPPVDGLNAEVHLDGRTLKARIAGGQVYNAQIAEGTAVIRDVLPQEKVLEIDGTVTGGVEDLVRFVRNSPLAGDAMLAAAADALTAGDMALDLDLEVPIRMPERKPAVNGRLRLEQARLATEDSRLALNDLEGEVVFSRDSAEASGIKGRFNGQPVEVAIRGGRQPGAPPPTLIVTGSAGPDDIAAELSRFFRVPADRAEAIADRLRGAADWEMALTFASHPETGTLTRELNLSSDLAGLAIDLPSPFGKVMGESTPLAITRRTGSGGEPELGIVFGNVLSAAVALDAEGAPRGARLHFGPGDAVGTGGEGVHASGYIEELDTAEWWRALKALAGEGNADTGRNAPFTAELRVGELTIPGQRFTDVALNATRNAAAWEVSVDSAAAKGTATLPRTSPGRPTLQLDFERLHFAESGSGNGGSAGTGQEGKLLDPARLPGVVATIEDFRYGAKELGRLSLVAEPVDHGIAVTQFEFAKKGLSIAGSGLWNRIDGTDRSSFTIALEAKEIGTMLNTFGYSVTPIRNGETRMDIEAAWDGTPMAFSLPNLAGKLNLQIRRGQLLEVSPKAGRLFGLLSIQTLPRRLSLDFSDLFGQGLAFDVIEGSFEIENGNAYTNNLSMRGPSANVEITGRTGLAEQDYDQLVTVTPQIADSLPVASALFGPVGIGVGAFLYLTNQLFSNTDSGIDSLLRYQYTITGSWQNPVIEEYQLASGGSG